MDGPIPQNSYAISDMVTMAKRVEMSLFSPFYGEFGHALGKSWAAALAVCLVWAISPGGAAAQGRVVNFYNWSDYIEPTVISAFTAATGIKVKYDTFDANETLETKLLAGKLVKAFEFRPSMA